MPSVSNAVVNLIIVGALLERWPQLKAHLSADVALTAIASAKFGDIAANPSRFAPRLCSATRKIIEEFCFRIGWGCIEGVTPQCRLGRRQT
jgi:hypothetical protein